MGEAASLLARLRALSGADPSRGLRFYPSYDSAPSFLPYAALPGAVAACADRYRDLGIGAGTRVLVPFETSGQVVVGFLALMALGALPLSTKPRTMGTPLDAYTSFLRALSARHGVRDVLDAPSLSSVELPLRRVPLPPEGLRGPAGASLPDPPPERLALVQFSSGSTADPKGIPITHGRLAENLRMITDNDRRTPEDAGCMWLPLHHDMGLIGGLLSPLYAGGGAHVASPTSFLMHPLGWLRQLSDRRAALSVIPSFAIEYCNRMLRDADEEDLRGLRLDALRCVYLGSEPINIGALEAFSERLAPYGLDPRCIKPCYGMAEAVLMVTCVGPTDMYRVITRPGGGRAISVGRPATGYELCVRSEAGALCADGEIGEIHVRGGSLADGYFEDDRRLLDGNGAYPTGDLGFMDDGELFVSGRIGDRMKINAESYFACQFEQALDGLRFTRPGRTAVFQSGDRVVVLIEVTPREARALAADAARRAAEVILQRVGVKVLPGDVLFVRPGQIERTTSGKIRRHAVAQAYAEGRVRLATLATGGRPGHGGRPAAGSRPD